MTPGATPFQFQRAMTVLECADLQRSLSFYREKLGFSAATWGEPPSFAIVQRGHVTIALNQVAAAPAMSRRTWATYVYVGDVDGLFAELTGLGVAVPEPPETKPYNCREFVVDDPDDHIIAFGQVMRPDALGPGLSEHVGRDERPVVASPTGPFSGGCQCGAVRFRARDLGRASHCHCRMCQKAFGAIGGTLVTVRDLAWTRGAPKRFHSSNLVQRGFCADCGTPLTFEIDGSVDVAIAAFDRAGDIAPVIQHARESRLPWADTLCALPVTDEAESAAKAAHDATIVSNQHPDHDTAIWEIKR